MPKSRNRLVLLALEILERVKGIESIPPASSISTKTHRKPLIY